MFADVVGMITHRRHNRAASRMAQLQDEIAALQQQMENVVILQAHDVTRDDGGGVDDTWTDDDVNWARDRLALLAPKENNATHPAAHSSSSSGGSSSSSRDSNDNVSVWDGDQERVGHVPLPMHATTTTRSTPLPSEEAPPLHADAASTMWWRSVEERLHIAFTTRGVGHDEGVVGTTALPALGRDNLSVLPPALPHDAFIEARLSLWRNRCFA